MTDRASCTGRELPTAQQRKICAGGQPQPQRPRGAVRRGSWPRSASGPQRHQKRRKSPGHNLTSGARNGDTGVPPTQRASGNGASIPPRVTSGGKSEENRAPMKLHARKQNAAQGRQRRHTEAKKSPATTGRAKKNPGSRQASGGCVYQMIQLKIWLLSAKQRLKNANEKGDNANKKPHWDSFPPFNSADTAR